jgi:hypothetical protein
MATRGSRCIKAPAPLRLEVERPLSRRHEARFEFERGPLACRRQRCPVWRRREGDHGWRIDSTKAVVRLAYSPRVQPHIPGPLLRRSPTAAPRRHRGRHSSGRSNLNRWLLHFINGSVHQGAGSTFSPLISRRVLSNVTSAAFSNAAAQAYTRSAPRRLLKRFARSSWAQRSMKVWSIGKIRFLPSSKYRGRACCRRTRLP